MNGTAGVNNNEFAILTDDISFCLGGLKSYFFDINADF